MYALACGVVRAERRSAAGRVRAGHIDEPRAALSEPFAGTSAHVQLPRVQCAGDVDQFLRIEPDHGPVFEVASCVLGNHPPPASVHVDYVERGLFPRRNLPVIRVGPARVAYVGDPPAVRTHVRTIVLAAVLVRGKLAQIGAVQPAVPNTPRPRPVGLPDNKSAPRFGQFAPRGPKARSLRRLSCSSTRSYFKTP
jgi:hypothetical protein